MMPLIVNEQAPVPPPAYQRVQARLGAALHIDAFTLVTTLHLLKGPCDEAPFAVHVTRSLSAWMLMKPGQDGLFQALLERCPGLQIAVYTRTAQELQVRSLECLADILSHAAAPCVRIREKLAQFPP